MLNQQICGCEQFTLQLSYANAFAFQHRSLGVLPNDQSRAIRSTNDQEAPRDMLKKHICTLQLTADHRMWDFVYRKNDKVLVFVFKRMYTPSLKGGHFFVTSLLLFEVDRQI